MVVESSPNLDGRLRRALKRLDLQALTRDLFHPRQGGTRGWFWVRFWHLKLVGASLVRVYCQFGVGLTSLDWNSARS